MAAPRAVWKGFLKMASVTCAVKLAGATSEAEKVSFRILNRKTGMPVKSGYIDEVTGETVETEDRIKGYELSAGDFLHIEEEEIKALKVQSEHVLEIDEFVDPAAIPSFYREKPYYLFPADKAAGEAFAVIREAIAKEKAAGVASITLYQ
ncbi:MAG: Ku protein, partial [Pseudaminobacter sp.]|nr:Ku protein [Pseudaminobacter sp.]